MDNHPPQPDPWDPQHRLEEPRPSADEPPAPAGGEPDPPEQQPPAPPPPAPPQQRFQPQAPQPLTTRVVGETPVPGPVVVTGGVQYIPAGLWPRVGAFLIDAVVLVIAHQIMLLVIGYTPPDTDELIAFLERMLAEAMTRGDFSAATYAQMAEMQQLSLFTGWLNVAICAAYYTVFHGMLGASLGKLCLGLVILRHDGSPIGYGIAFVRYLGYFIVAKLLYTAWLIPFNREKRTVYDILLGTNVYRPLPGQEN